MSIKILRLFSNNSHFLKKRHIVFYGNKWNIMVKSTSLKWSEELYGSVVEHLASVPKAHMKISHTVVNSSQSFQGERRVLIRVSHLSSSPCCHLAALSSIWEPDFSCALSFLHVIRRVFFFYDRHPKTHTFMHILGKCCITGLHLQLASSDTSKNIKYYKTRWHRV